MQICGFFFFFPSLLMSLLMLKTWSGLSEVGSCSLSFPSRSPALSSGCCVAAFRFFLSQIITNMSAVTSADAGWNDTSHPLPLSISSRCSRLMELLIGGNSGFPDARFPRGRDVWGVDPVLICCCSRKPLRCSYMCLHLSYPTTLFIWLLYILLWRVCDERRQEVHCKK